MPSSTNAVHSLLLRTHHTCAGEHLLPSPIMFGQASDVMSDHNHLRNPGRDYVNSPGTIIWYLNQSSSSSRRYVDTASMLIIVYERLFASVLRYYQQNPRKLRVWQNVDPILRQDLKIIIVYPKIPAVSPELLHLLRPALHFSHHHHDLHIGISIRWLPRQWCMVHAVCVSVYYLSAWLSVLWHW
jgi:hypothetical protein